MESAVEAQPLPGAGSADADVRLAAASERIAALERALHAAEEAKSAVQNTAALNAQRAVDSQVRTLQAKCEATVHELGLEVDAWCVCPRRHMLLLLRGAQRSVRLLALRCMAF
jgi:hypothetical protein